jgi:hypothetical protein
MKKHWDKHVRWPVAFHLALAQTLGLSNKKTAREKVISSI